MAISFVPLREFIPQVQQAVQKCPVPLMVNALRQAAIDFCKEAKVWKQSDITFSTAAGTSAYVLAAPANSDICSIVMVKYGDDRLLPVFNEEMDELPSSDSGQPTRFTFEEPMTVTFWPTPDAVGTVTVKAALQPVYNASQVPDFLLSRYKEGIVARAKAELMKIPDKPWTDFGLSQACEQDFKRAVNEATISVNKGGTRKSMTVRPRPFI